MKSLRELHNEACAKFGETETVARLRAFYEEIIGSGDECKQGCLHNKDTIRQIIDDLNARTKGRFRASNKATIKHINARLSEGFNLDDFIGVNTIQTMKWLNTPDEKYLRPQTLYNSEKMPGYLADWNRYRERVKEEEKAQVETRLIASVQQKTIEENHSKEAQLILQAKADLQSNKLKKWNDFESYHEFWCYSGALKEQEWKRYEMPEELRRMQSRYIAIKISGNKERIREFEQIYRGLVERLLNGG